MSLNSNMKTDTIKKIQITLIALLTVVLMLMFWNTLFPVVKTVGYADVTAEEIVESRNEFDKSPVLDDLLSSTLSGQSFDVGKYPYDENKSADIISLVEYCFSYRANQMDDYALYVYVYNPSGKNISRTGSRIQMATAWDDNWNATEYKRFALEFCSRSDGEYSQLFYKFKVNTDYFKTVMPEQSSARHYAISGIQLNYDDENLSGRELTVQMSYTFTGFAKGYGPDREESTLSCTSGQIETLRLNVEDCFWRFNEGASSRGKNHQDQVNSVYFAVPKETLNKYGTLSAISAEWYEYKTKEILVTNDHNSDGMYYKIYKYLGVPTSEIPDVDTYSIVSSYTDYTYTGAYTSVTTYDWSYNYNPDEHGDKVFNRFSTRNDCQILYYAFLRNNLEKNSVSAEEILEHIEKYSSEHPEDILLDAGNNQFSSKMFTTDVDEGHTRGYNYVHIDNGGDYNLNLRGYDSNHDIWARFRDYGSFKNINENYNYDISPIEEIESYESIKNLSEDDISSKYFIDKSHVKAFRDYVENYDDNYVTWLFRFSATDYYALDVNDMTGKAHGYIAQTTLFADFKVIDLTFAKDDIYTVIPVVQDPINIMSDATEPIPDTVAEYLEKKFKEFGRKVQDWWDNAISSIKDFFAKYRVVFIVTACVLGVSAIVGVVIKIKMVRKVSSASNTYNYYDHDKPRKNKSKRR